MKVILVLIITNLFLAFSSYPQSQVKWYSFSSGFGFSKLNGSTITSAYGVSFAGISSNRNSKIISGFLTYNSSIVTDVNNEQENIPAVFKLYQNYPNPFNPTTTIKYSVPNVEDANFASSTNTQLIVYDILGRKVATLVNENKQPGNYEVRFNASNLPSGVYFYRLSIGSFGKTIGFEQTRKMVLIR